MSLLEDIQALELQVQSSIGPVLERHPLPDFISLMQRRPDLSAYNFVPDAAVEFQRALVKGEGEKIAGRYFGCALLAIMRLNEPGIERLQVPSSIKARLASNFRRIATTLATDAQTLESCSLQSDRYLKDLSLCQLRLLPAGAQKVIDVKLPLRVVASQDQLRFASFVALRLRGRSPIYDMHTDSNDPELMAEFSEDGWRSFYRAAAQLLEMSPGVIGMFGIGWFFDPAVSGISPRLGYLKTIAEESGANLFCVGETEGARASALSTSPTRRKLFEDGMYRPKDYMALWSRADLIAWVRAQR